jgi:hypothetical protein
MEMTKIREGLFAVLGCSILNHIKLGSRSLFFAERVRFEMISKPKSPHYLRFENVTARDWRQKRATVIRA